MASLNLIVEEVLIETARRISELECLVVQADNAEERRSLRIAIVELKQVLQVHYCASMMVH
jgi:hypothetical protein